MNCREIRDSLLTDYLDKQLNVSMETKIEMHLRECVDCRAFLEEVKQTVIEPFKQNDNIAISQEAVWQNVKEQIEEEKAKQRSFGLEVFLEHVKGWFVSPKPVYVLTMLLIVVLTTVMFGRKPQQEVANKILIEEETAEYMASLDEEDENMALDEDSGYGTAIETFLL